MIQYRIGRQEEPEEEITELIVRLWNDTEVGNVGNINLLVGGDDCTLNGVVVLLPNGEVVVHEDTARRLGLRVRVNDS